MGAAVGKAAEDLAGAPEAKVAARLAFAKHAMLQWNRSPGADSGIWDADASNTNRGLLSAVDEVLLLAEADPLPAADSPARCHLDNAVAIVMSRMVEEFLRVRVWNASRLRFAVDRLALASSGASPSAGNRTNSTSTGGRTSSASTGRELDASDGSQPRVRWSVPDEVAALMDGEFLDELDLVCPAGVSVLHEIAQRVIRADGTKEFLWAFRNAPCDVLDSFLSILRVECSRRTTEVVIERWSAVTKIVEKAVLAMRRQLYEQTSGAFDIFRDEYLLSIAECRVLVLLQFADAFTTLTLHEKLVHVLSMYEALSDAAPGLLLLFTGARKQLVAERTEDILTKLAGVVRTMVNGLLDKIQTDSSHTLSVANGVHPLTRYALARIEQLSPHRHRTVLGLILASGDVDAPAGGAVASFGSLVAELVGGLERNLEEKSTLIFTEAGGSASSHLFLANNTSFVLNRATDADVVSLLGAEWVARRRSQMEQHLVSYVEASWGPVIACLETSCKPAKALSKFNAAFKKAHGSQVCREVPDPALRAALRKAVSNKVVPAYITFLQKHPKLEKSVRYSSENLAESLSNLYESEATNG